MNDTLITQPMPARLRVAAAILLGCRRFSCDALLVAADAFDEASRVARWNSALMAADQAAEVAELLRAEAPARAMYPFHQISSPGLAALPAELLS